MKLSIVTLIMCLAAPAVAYSAQTEWLETDGGNVRIVVAPIAVDDDKLRGFIDIDLLQGWKTYWRNPGSSGVPPMLELRNGTTAKISYPLPSWIDTKYGSYAGYDAPVKLPLEIDLSAIGQASEIDARLMVGICEDICIPAFSDFSLPIEKAIGSDASTAAVANAVANLPKTPNKYGLTIESIVPNNQTVEFSINSKHDLRSLFVAGSGSVQFSKPEIIEQETGTTRYRAYVLQPVKVATPITLYIAGDTTVGAFEFQQKVTMPAPQ